MRPSIGCSLHETIKKSDGTAGIIGLGTEYYQHHRYRQPTPSGANGPVLVDLAGQKHLGGTIKTTETSSSTHFSKET
jgi:hypothetical protein